MNYRAIIAGLVFVSAVSPTRADDRLPLAALQNAGAIVKHVDASIVSLTLNLRDVTADENRALKELEVLPWLELIGSGDTALTTQTLKALQNKPSLKRLSISYTRIDDDCAAMLGKLTHLNTLELRSQVDMTPFGLQEISNLRNLSELTLSDRLVNNEVLEDLKRLPNLKVLNVRSVFVTDEGLASIWRLSHLRTLRIHLGPRVTDVGLRRLADLQLKELEITLLNGTDDKVKQLRKLSRLRTLNLINASGISDQSLPYLSELTELKLLDLGDARLTKADIEQLKKQLPGCTFVSSFKKRS